MVHAYITYTDVMTVMRNYSRAKRREVELTDKINMASNTCMICGKTLVGIALCDVRGNCVCSRHERELKYCYSCGSFVKDSDLQLKDGRILCSTCSKAIVRHPEDVKWIIAKVRDYLSEAGISDLPDAISLQVVTAHKINLIRNDGKIILSNPGLTLSQCVNYGLFKKKWKHAIYVLDNIPKVQFAGILSHELLHAWLNEREYDFPTDLTEGFCNLGSYVTYLKIDNAYSRILAENLRNDKSEIYGDGFRKVVSVYQDGGSLSELAHQLKMQIKMMNKS